MLSATIDFERSTENGFSAPQNFSVGYKHWKIMIASTTSLQTMPAKRESDGTTELLTLFYVALRIALWLKVEEIG